MQKLYFPILMKKDAKYRHFVLPAECIDYIFQFSSFDLAFYVLVGMFDLLWIYYNCIVESFFFLPSFINHKNETPASSYAEQQAVSDLAKLLITVCTIGSTMDICGLILKVGLLTSVALAASNLTSTRTGWSSMPTSDSSSFGVLVQVIFLYSNRHK